MRLCVRLAVMAALLVGLAVGLIWLRTDTAQAGNRLHMLFRQKRDLERECCRLEMSIAGLKNVARLRQQAIDFRQEADDPGGAALPLPPEKAARPRPILADRGKRPPP
jgi:cell division protein FtsL